MIIKKALEMKEVGEPRRCHHLSAEEAHERQVERRGRLKVWGRQQENNWEAVPEYLFLSVAEAVTVTNLGMAASIVEAVIVIEIGDGKIGAEIAITTEIKEVRLGPKEAVNLVLYLAPILSLWHDCHRFATEFLMSFTECLPWIEYEQSN